MSFITSGINSILQPSLLDGNSAALGAAGKAMAELAVAGCIGATCVQQNVLTPDMIRALSKTSFSILLPMFLMTSIIRTVATYGLSRSSLQVPLLGILHAFVLLILSKHLLLPLLGIDNSTDEGRSTTVCCAWGNSGVVPLIFAEALFRNQPELLSKCYAQISLFLMGWSPFFWSYGERVLLGSDDTSNDAGKTKRLFPPPVVGIMSGLLLAVSPLRPIFMSTSDHHAPLTVVFESFQYLGNAGNPLALLVLTSSMAMGVGGKQQQQSKRGGGKQQSKKAHASNSTSKLKSWVCVSIARFLVSPLLMLGMLKAMESIGVVDDSKKDPMLWFVLLLESCMPPAQNSVLMLQVADKPVEAGRMAKFLFSLYATAMLPVMVIVTMALKAFELDGGFWRILATVPLEMVL
jgi:predicted permease